jgi:hypothetical protein
MKQFCLFDPRKSASKGAFHQSPALSLVAVQRRAGGRVSQAASSAAATAAAA